MRAKMGELLSFCRKAGNGFYLWLCGERYAWLLPIVLIVALLVTAWIFQYHSYDATARRLGKQGEAKVRRLLKNTKSLKKRILNDVILTVEYGNTVQIDHILIKFAPVDFVRRFERYTPDYYLPLSDHSPVFADVVL